MSTTMSLTMPSAYVELSEKEMQYEDGGIVFVLPLVALGIKVAATALATYFVVEAVKEGIRYCANEYGLDPGVARSLCAGADVASYCVGSGGAVKGVVKGSAGILEFSLNKLSNTGTFVYSAKDW